MFRNVLFAALVMVPLGCATNPKPVDDPTALAAADTEPAEAPEDPPPGPEDGAEGKGSGGTPATGNEDAEDANPDAEASPAQDETSTTEPGATAPVPAAENPAETPAADENEPEAKANSKPKPKAKPKPKPKTNADPTKGTISGTVTTRPSSYKRNVVVHLVNGPKSRSKAVKTMNQKGMKFTPHVLPVVVGTTVKFLNNDDVRHNVFSPDGEKYDLGTWSKGEVRKRRYIKPGEYRQLCNVHPEMSAVVLVLDTRHFDKTNGQGRFELENVPPGTYKIKAWGEKLAPVTKTVTVTAGKAARVDFSMKKK